MRTFALATLLLAGCGASSPRAACESLVDAFQQRLAACGLGYVHLTGSEDIDNACGKIAALAGAMSVRFDAAAAGPCRDELLRAPCDASGIATQLSLCARRVFVGSKAAGAACTNFAECTGACDAGGGQCPGVCRPLAKAGDSCAASDCEALSVCDRKVNPPRCVALPGEGRACTGPLQLDCAPGLYCDAGTCRARHTAASACKADGECAAGTRCAGTDLLKRTCVPWLLLGAACQADEDCVPGLLCDGGACRQLLAQPGELCGRVPAHTRPVECVSGYCSNPLMGGTCTRYLELSAPCDDKTRCQPGAACSGGKCTPYACF